MSQMKIHHELGEILVKPADRVNAVRLKRFIHEALDRYQENDRVPASVIHDAVREQNNESYRTPGYFLRLYRLRAELTQAQLASRIGVRQHHLSEMERNKRAISKPMAQRLAAVLDCDYRRFL